LIKHNGKTIKKFGKYSVIDCRRCKFIHVIPVPSNQELNSFYDNEYFQKIKPNFISKNENEMDYWNLVFDEKLVTIEKLISSKSKRILDIGSGPGFFLRRAKRRGGMLLVLNYPHLHVTMQKNKTYLQFKNFFMK
jgi:hypothetical protein